MTDQILSRITDLHNTHDIGGKGRQVRWLQAAGFKVPVTFVIPAESHSLYRQERAAFLARLGLELEKRLAPGMRYAVRSSANIEDGNRLSFAGQFTTRLDVSEASGICQAVEEIYQRVESAELQPYLAHADTAPEAIQIAVLIQEMVSPLVSGAAFSKNPLTGLNEVIIEAVQGHSQAFLQGSATPQRWVFKWGGWTEQPAHSAVDLALVREVALKTQEIERSYGSAVDVEWAYDGSALYWLQVRPVTSLQEVNIYSNRIAREVLPGIIKPLVWSVNTPLVNGAWTKLFSELIGPNELDPLELSKSFHYRAYFNMGAIGRIFEILGFPRESLELLMGLEGGSERPRFKPTARTYRHLPRMAAFAVRKLRYDRQVEEALHRLRESFQRFARQDPDSLAPQEILEQTDALFRVAQEAAWFNIVIPLLQRVYTALFKRQIEKLGHDFAAFNLSQDFPDLADYDPNPHLDALRAAYRALDEPSRMLIQTADFASLSQDARTQGFHQELARFLERFGHLSDSGNDFSVPPWRETPALVVSMATQAAQSDRESRLDSWQDLHIPVLRRLPLEFLYQRARRYHLYREAISSLYTYGYGQFRNYFLSLGDRLVNQDILGERDDIFYLSIDEIKSVFETQAGAAEIQPLVDQRKTEIEAARNVILPELIFGDQPPPLETDLSLEKLKGTATSRGYYRGPVTVIRSSQEFDRLSAGDVLVIPYSDVGWTPLFTKAGAVIAESGGLLSHSSIIAREFNIPCVVSVNNACRLPEGTIVTIDGYSGEIAIHQ